MAYRHPDELRDLDLDARELIAAEALGKRRSRLETRFILIAVLIGFAVGVPGYFFVQELQLRLVGLALGYGSALGFFGPAAVMAALGLRLARRTIRRRTPGWIEELERTYQVPRARLEELVLSLHALA